jgi:CubicO group peptidase (beta-lactamase class C family)
MNIQPTNEQVDRIFEEFTRPGSPGCALAVMQGGEVVYKQGYGLADLENKLPILPATVFNIGSMAKQFTAFAIALLEDRGQLAYDDDFRKYLPEMHDFGKPITIRHLLHHTSGIRCTFPDLLFLAEWRESDATSTEDVLRLLKRQRELDFPTGSEYAYANSNYILLALICARVSGESFAEFCRQQIFEPLGIASTVVNEDYFKIIPRRASGYYGEEGDWFNAPLTDSVIGSTNVYTTVEDLALWDENFYTAQVGGQRVIDQLDEPGHLEDGTQTDYAFGLMVGPTHQHRGWQVVEHGGGQGGYVCHMARFPELHLSVAALFNCYLWNARDKTLQVADCFLEEKQPRETPPASTITTTAHPAGTELTAEQLQPKTGKYFDPQRVALREVRLQDGRLQYQGFNLVPLSAERFYLEDEPDVLIEFQPAPTGHVRTIKTITASGEYTYERVASDLPAAENLEDFTGIYYSPELDLRWEILLGDGQLVVRRRKFVDTRLTPVFKDAFNDDWQPVLGWPWAYTIIFQRDAEGVVNELTVSGSRIRRLKFIRQTG